MTDHSVNHVDHPAVIRDMTGAEFALHAGQEPEHPGILYRVDATALYRWNGSAWVAFA